MFSELFDVVYNFLLSTIGSLGYFGIFFLMIIESSFIPFPSEIVLIPAGALAASGQQSIPLILFLAICGSLIGALINYYLAFFLGRNAVNHLVKQYGRFFFLSERSLEKSDEYFRKHGGITTFVGRLIPAVRQLISIPAGFSKMNLGKFCFYTSLGAGVWSAILIYVGYMFGSNLEIIRANLNEITYVVVGLCFIFVIGYIIYYRKRKKG